MSMPADVETIQLFRDMVETYVAKRYPFSARFGLERDGPGYEPAAWAAYADMGWLAIALDEASGGFDADPHLVGAIMEGVGAGLLLEPIFASAIVSARLLRLLDWQGGQGLRPADIASGEAVLTLAHLEVPDASPWDDIAATVAQGRLAGTKIAVLNGDTASHIVMTAVDPAGTPVIALVRGDAPGVVRTGHAMLDGRRAATILVDTDEFVQVGTGARARAAYDRAIDEGVVALCGEAIGAITALNRLTLDYLGERRQFGRPIGANQILQHRMVECFIVQAEAAAVTAVARNALVEADDDERVRTVSAAKAVVASAGRHVANEAVQMHGGIGMTHEYAVSHFFKRLRVIELLLGGRRHHLRRFADYGGVTLA